MKIKKSFKDRIIRDIAKMFNLLIDRAVLWDLVEEMGWVLSFRWINKFLGE